MKTMRWIGLAVFGVIVACATVVPPTSIPWPAVVVIEAQSLPYTLTATWTASPDTGVTSYNCYLDGTLMITVGNVTSCQFAVPTLGPHTVGVTAVNPTAIPTESAPGGCAAPLPTTCGFTLKQPSPASGVKVK